MRNNTLAALSRALGQIVTAAPARKGAVKHKTPVKEKAAQANQISLKIPAGVSPYVHGKGDFGQAKNWKVQILEGNSLSKGKKIGELDNVGYIYLNPKSGEVVPIARGDEHHAGHDMMLTWRSKGAISNLGGFTPIYIHNTYVYDSEDYAPYREAFQFWLDHGGPDIAVEIYRTGTAPTGQADVFAGSLSQFIAQKDFKPKPNEIAPIGKQIIKALEQAALALKRSLQDPRHEVQFLKAADQVLRLKDQYRMPLLGVFKTEPLKALEKALAQGDVKETEKALFGFNGLKNELHQQLREPDGKSPWHDSLVKVFGDLKSALKAFDALGNI